MLPHLKKYSTLCNRFNNKDKLMQLRQPLNKTGLKVASRILFFIFQKSFFFLFYFFFIFSPVGLYSSLWEMKLGKKKRIPTDRLAVFLQPFKEYFCNIQMENGHRDMPLIHSRNSKLQIRQIIRAKRIII